jgi:hypothetical protein
MSASHLPFHRTHQRARGWEFRELMSFSPSAVVNSFQHLATDLKEKHNM